MRFTFRVGQVTIRAVADDSEQRSHLSWEGPADEVKVVQDLLENSTGPFGHYIFDGVGPVRPGDVAFVLAMSDLKWQLEDGVISEYKSAPEGCVS